MAPRIVTSSLTRNALARAVGAEIARIVTGIERAEMVFGVHHVWTREQVYTPAGLTLLLERLAATYPAAVADLEGAIVFSENHDGPPELGAPVHVEHAEASADEINAAAAPRAKKSDREPHYFWQDSDE